MRVRKLMNDTRLRPCKIARTNYETNNCLYKGNKRNYLYIVIQNVCPRVYFCLIGEFT